jgi:D-glycero-D-manno-heptose 1,7-bisphosphate phosphatase
VLAVVSNQRGIARGLVSMATLGEIELEIQSRLRERGVEIAAFRYCPHELDAGCDCRKPAPGMLLELSRTLELDLARCWMIGDADSDVGAGRAAGCRTALIDAAGERGDGAADVVAGSLAQVAEAIVARDGGG